MLGLVHVAPILAVGSGADAATGGAGGLWAGGPGGRWQRARLACWVSPDGDSGEAKKDQIDDCPMSMLGRKRTSD